MGETGRYGSTLWPPAPLSRNTDDLSPSSALFLILRIFHSFILMRQYTLINRTGRCGVNRSTFRIDVEFLLSSSHVTNNMDQHTDKKTIKNRTIHTLKKKKTN